MDIGGLVHDGKHALSTAVFEVGAVGYAFLTRDPVWRDHCGKLAELAQVKPGDRVLDLGSGPGISAFGMTDRVPSIDVVGVDLSRTMTLLAEAFRAIEPSKNHVSFVRADATHLDFPDASFDAVTGHSFLYLVPRPDLILSEARRVLRPGGRLVFLEPSVTTFPALLPPEIWNMGPRAPRFTLAMALWRFYSRGHGRFDEARFQRLFQGAGLSFLECRKAVSGLGLYGIAERSAA